MPVHKLVNWLMVGTVQPTVMSEGFTGELSFLFRLPDDSLEGLKFYP